MNYTITSNLSANLYNFLIAQSNQKKTTKRKIIEEALSLYKKHQLASSIKEGLQERNKEYKDISNEAHAAQGYSLNKHNAD